MTAGRGLCDENAVNILSQKSHESISKLIELGVFFDKDQHGDYRLGLEGAHSLPRILYAGGDATGAEIQRALAASVHDHQNISILEDSHVVEIINEDGHVEGVVYYDGSRKRIYLECDQIVLATGGAGQIYRYTSNPDTATGEGNVLAYTAGAELADLEFYQFHPTGLNVPNAANFLISEAVRGEGAILRNMAGKAIMEGVHPLKDLAPRDIVARTIANEMIKTSEKVFLDATGINPQKLEKRFPTISKSCLKFGIDIRKNPIPITPVAHYMIGGVVTDLSGRTTVKGLYASGEVARTGVHGANRLASNSLLECSVFSIRVANSMLQDQMKMPDMWQHQSGRSQPDSELSFPAEPQLELPQFQNMMWQHVGLSRNKSSLMTVIETLKNTPVIFNSEFSPERFELFALKNLGRIIALSALQREESRGSHFRFDFPDSKDSFLYSIKRTINRDKCFFR